MNEQLPVTSAISSDKSIMEDRPFITTPSSLSTLADFMTGALVYSTNPILQAARQRQRELLKRIARDNKDRWGWSTAELTVFEERVDSNFQGLIDESNKEPAECEEGEGNIQKRPRTM